MVASFVFCHGFVCFTYFRSHLIILALSLRPSIFFDFKHHYLSFLYSCFKKNRHKFCLAHIVSSLNVIKFLFLNALLLPHDPLNTFIRILGVAPFSHLITSYTMLSLFIITPSIHGYSKTKIPSQRYIFCFQKSCGESILDLYWNVIL